MNTDRKRSLDQNALYWKWMSEISEQAVTTDGQKLTKDQWHYLCSLKFLGIDKFQVEGIVYRVPSKSTTKLSVEKFSSYLGEIEAEFVARGVNLTFPDDKENLIKSACK